jgi:hypothetical protein
MDSRDFIIIGAVAVAAFWWYRNRQTVTVPLPAGSGTTSNMTASAAASTTPPPRSLGLMTNQVGPATTPLGGGFFALNNTPLRFGLASATAIISDNIAPAPVTRPPVVASPTVVGGAGVSPIGANTMGPRPITTTLINPVRY